MMEYFQPLPTILFMIVFTIISISSSQVKSMNGKISRAANELIITKAALTVLWTNFAYMSLWWKFSTTEKGYQEKFTMSLVSEYDINFSLGIDGISLPFIFLTTFIMFLCIINVDADMDNCKQYIINLLLIELFLLISFMTTDIFCFYVFFESVLIPMFLVVGYWGSRERKTKAAFYLFLYTLFGSLFLLFGIFFLYFKTGSTSYEVLANTKLDSETQIALWICFFLPFAIKIPMIPVHIWLPEAHVEAPTVGSVILASLLLKLGGYGFLRFTLPMFPVANDFFSPLIYTLGIVGIIYASMSTLRQIDLKRIIAYASIAHMNVVVLGLFSYTQQGIDGAIFLMIAHGFTSSGLFFVVGCLYDRYKTRLLEYYGGLVQIYPFFAFIFCLFSFANMGFPGTANFTGEFITLAGLFESNSFAMVWAGTGIFLSAVYSIWLYNRICFGTLKMEYIKQYYANVMEEKEIFILVSLAFLTVYFGLNSTPITDLTQGPVSELLITATQNRIK
jgi:NADH-quinone oxidoreductase subunit M